TLPNSTKVHATHPLPDTAVFHEAISKEGSVQASIRTGRRFIMRNHPDYHVSVFVAHVLGGYFGSRLMKNIREEKGLTYGIYASIQPLQHAGFLVIGADVNRENVDVTLDEIRKELRSLRTEAIPQAELETAKNHFIGTLQAEITTPFAHADKIKTIILSQLSTDFYQKMIAEVSEINPARIMEITDRYFHEDSFSSVSVG
ncbi:MAG TPA: insulinase family protein, partial [Chryseosolibacter sp.]|nr:insulinase family protein [Chryseosolibacter sp.]